MGIFAKTFLKPSLEAVLDCVNKHGFTQVQFNMSSAGLSSLPDYIDPALMQKIHAETHVRNIQIAAVSGTFNMIHPDPTQRRAGLQKLRTLAKACKQMGTSVITLCTGTRDPENMWRKHPENTQPQAWTDLLETMESAIHIAEEHQVTLAFEPEQANLVDTAEKGRKLLNEVRSELLKVVMDAANLFKMDNIHQMQETMDKAFELLGADIVVAHAKDIIIANRDIEFVAAGEGIIDYDAYLRLLRHYGFKGALILHGLEEEQVGKSVRFLQQKLQVLN